MAEQEKAAQKCKERTAGFGFSKLWKVWRAWKSFQVQPTDFKFSFTVRLLCSSEKNQLTGQGKVLEDET